MSSPPGPITLTPKWHSPAQVAVLLGFSLTKVKTLIATRQLRSIKDGKHRRILPEWIDEYIHMRAEQQDEEWIA
jgi:excisionase family DNA binding protein